MDYEKLWLELKAHVIALKDEDEKKLAKELASQFSSCDYYENGLSSGRSAVIYDFFDKMNELESK